MMSLRLSSVPPQKDSRTFVEWIIGIRLEEQVLQTNHDRVEIKDRFPVLTKDIETHVAIQVDVRVIDLCKYVNAINRAVSTRSAVEGTTKSGKRPTFCVHLTLGGSCG